VNTRTDSNDESRVFGWNEAVDAAAKVADQLWVSSNSLAGSKVAREIADRIRDLRLKVDFNANSHRNDGRD
jgi:hypothetical protein